MPARSFEAEESLRRSEERFRALVDASAQIVWTTTGTGEVVAALPSWQSFTGQTADEVREWGWLDAVHPDDRERTAAVWRDAVKTRQPVELEHRIRHRSGEWRWTAMRAVPLLNGDGAVREWVGMNTDITERRDSAERFRLAIEASPTGMLMVDRAGRIVLVNAQVEKLFGYQRRELMGQRLDMLVPERFRGRHPGYRGGFFDRPVARPMGRGRDLRGLRKDGTEIPIEIGLTPLSMPEGDFVLSSIVDITERKRAEQDREDLMGQLRALNADLEDRVRFRTGELAAALMERETLLQEVHHRVKNNLQVISSLINMQMRRLDEGTSRDALVECQARIQVIALVHEKLYQSKDHAHVPVSDYMRSLANMVLDASGASPSVVSLELALDDVGLPVDKAIPCGLLLNELITNALKHGFKDGRPGTIRVELERVENERLRLMVKDDGAGLPPGFEVARAESLGLQLVVTLARQLGAELEVTGGHGATFQLVFPAGRA